MRHALAVVAILSVCLGSGNASSVLAAAPEQTDEGAGKPIIVRMPEAVQSPQQPSPSAAAATQATPPAAGATPETPTASSAHKKSNGAPAPALPQNVSPAPTPAPTPSNAASAASAYQTERLTARHFFATLPTGIFETTAEGLDESQKQELLVNGKTDFWELAGETDDVIVFTALPFRDSGVAVRLFRNEQDGSVLAAIGTLGGEMCTVELWRMDRDGRTIPVDTPQEPGVREFFAKDAVLPKDINPSVSICLGRGGLVARPIFWNASGMVHVPLAHDVSYQWDGRHFQKQIQPHQETTENGF
ncbi:hypothetical protein [uncultured Desulfovibrio sp.]|uniref:hypothetical protein n=1 Tax=uncultured Desulfovibrio sp. TaxID=167968 RepID=UPI00262E875D|nr:hypothetical protein [uncultured Desulfovibrio sp.]